jgi:uncharacterized coiled-coil DUF342 family protein
MSDEATQDVEASQALLQEKLNEISVSVLERGSVSAASQKSDAAGARVRQLKESQKQLRTRASELSDEISRLTALCQDSLIEQFAGAKGVPDISKQLGSLPGLQIEHKLVTQAATQIAEHLLPKAEIAEVRAVADHSTAQADALREVAAERLRRTNELIAGAAEHEGEITYDPAKTISGVLLAQAKQLDTVAGNHRKIAHDREQDYERAQRQRGKSS